MTDMERRKFEDSFKEAFEGAEASPSEKVWTNIELDLEKADGGKIRRRLLFYKMLAAAAVTFALGIAGIGYYMLNERNENVNDKLASSSSGLESNEAEDAELKSNNIGQDGSATANAPEISSPQGEGNLNVEPDNVHNPALDQTSSVNKGASQEISGFVASDNSHNDLKDQASSLPEQAKDDQFLPSTLGSEISSNLALERKLPAFYSRKDPELIFHDAKPDPGALLLAKLAQEERRYAELDKKEEKDKSERLWTSVGFAAGGFSSLNPSVSGAAAASNSYLAASNSTVPDKQAKASGVAYSIGVSVGTKLSKRWVLQGGFNYLTQSSDYTATNVVAANNFSTLKAESINELDKLPQIADQNAAAKLAPTVPYSVNNNLQFFSVPVQAGYLIVNKKFGLQLNAGVSTDLFLQNTITPEGGSLDKTTQGRGDDSPYRSVNFSGLMGTELSYKFGQRYRIALNPGLRYPLNSVYKTDVGIESTPLTFDVGLRFRYIFH